MTSTEQSRSPMVNPTITLPLKTVIVTNLFRAVLSHDINHQLTYRCLVWNSWHASISIQPNDWFWAVGRRVCYYKYKVRVPMLHLANR